MKENNKPLTLLGFDYGTKSIGVAIGQTVTNTAKPLNVIKYVLGEPDWEQIEILMKEWQPNAIVVGLPLNMDGSEQPLTREARNFIKQLKNRFNIPVYEMDERLTTKEARAELFEESGYKALKKESIDALSAKIILESWLDQNHAA